MNLPNSTKVNRFVAKNKFYSKVIISPKIKEDFIKKVEKITWLYKLSPDTLNVDNSKDVEEIEIFEIILKEKKIPLGVLNTIAKSIPYKILFIIRYDENKCYATRIDDIYITEWNKEFDFEFKGFTLESIYQNLIKTLMEKKDSNDNFEKIISDKRKKEELIKKINNLEVKVKNEKQFDRQVEYNKELNKIKNELKKMEEEII